MEREFKISERAALVSQTCALRTFEKPTRTQLPSQNLQFNRKNKQTSKQNKTKQNKTNERIKKLMVRRDSRCIFPATFPATFEAYTRPLHVHVGVAAKMAASFSILRKEMKLTCSAL